MTSTGIIETNTTCSDIALFSERMKEDIDPEMKESYREHIEDFQKLKEKVNNTPEC